MKYSLHPDAGAEHLACIALYESRRRGLGALYLAAFNAAMARVCRDPARFRIECEPGLRRILLRGFPLSIIYREIESEVQVQAVAQHRRRPGHCAESDPAGAPAQKPVTECAT